MSFLKENLPDCHVIIHKARNVSVLKDNGILVDLATSGRVKRENAQMLNHYWNKMDQYVIDHYSVSVIEINDQTYYTYNEHPWGPFYVHYTGDYYHKFLFKLHQIVLENYFEDMRAYKILAEIFEQYEDLKKKTEILNHDLMIEMRLNKELQKKIQSTEEENYIGV